MKEEGRKEGEGIEKEHKTKEGEREGEGRKEVKLEQPPLLGLWDWRRQSSHEEGETGAGLQDFGFV